MRPADSPQASVPSGFPGLSTALPVALGLGLLIFGAHEVWLPPGAALTFRTWIRPTLWLLTALLFWHRGRQPEEHPEGWNWIAFSHLLRAVALVVYQVYPSLPVRMALFALATILLVVGFLRWFEQGLLWGGGIRRVLDGIIVTLALVTLAWGQLAPLTKASATQSPASLVAVTLLYALLLGILIAQALVDLRRLRGPLGWACLYLVAELVTHLLIQPSTRARAMPVGQLLVLSPPSLTLLMAVVPFVPWTRDALTRSEGRGQGLWGVALVHIPAGLAVAGVLLALRPGMPQDIRLVVLVCLLCLVLLVRQVLALKDLASSCHLLQNQLDLRTRSLEEHQAVLRRNQQMNLLSTVGAGLAHDFNNLITVIVLEAEQGRLDNVLASARKAADLNKRLMTLARPEVGSVELFELGELLRSRMDLFEKVCPRSIRLTLTREPEECWMEADPLQIEQVMLNLILNAADAIQGNGSVRIRLHRLSDGQALLEVEDSGPGMSPEVRDRIFQPFFTTKPEGQGTGLGLPSVQTIIESLGGTVAVVTELGLGTTFLLRLPTVDVD